MLRADDVSGIFLLLFVILLMLAFAGGVMLFLRRAGVEMAADQAGGWERTERPWWGNPLLWLGAGVAFTLLGLFVLPHFLGGAFLFLPFFWAGGWRRRRPSPRCPRCGRILHPSFRHCPDCGMPVG